MDKTNEPSIRLYVGPITLITLQPSVDGSIFLIRTPTAPARSHVSFAPSGYTSRLSSYSLTYKPSQGLSFGPTVHPSSKPIATLNSFATGYPSSIPTLSQSVKPSFVSSRKPSDVAHSFLSVLRNVKSSRRPSNVQFEGPSFLPSFMPSAEGLLLPIKMPALPPTDFLSLGPSAVPVFSLVNTPSVALVSEPSSFLSTTIPNDDLTISPSLSKTLFPSVTSFHKSSPAKQSTVLCPHGSSFSGIARRTEVEYYYSVEARANNTNDFLPDLEEIMLLKISSKLLYCKRRNLSARTRQLELVGVSSMPEDSEYRGGENFYIQIYFVTEMFFFADFRAVLSKKLLFYLSFQ